MKKEKPKVIAQKLWAVAYANGGWIDPSSVRHTRRQAIAAFCSDPAGYDWDYWKAQGARPVKIVVSGAP